MARIAYELQRSKRKTIVIKVINGAVFVLAPSTISTKIINDFVHSKAEWIASKLDKYQEHAQKYEHLLKYHVVLLGGDTIEIDFLDNINTKLIDNVLYINRKYFGLDDKISRQIANYYKKLALRELGNKLTRIASDIQMPYKSFGISSAKKKWGSCDSRNNILLNFRLIMLPVHLQSYVIIHELCHTMEHNHNKNFWSMVSTYCPLYKKYKKELAQYSIVNTIY